MICSATKKDGTACKGEAKKDGLCIAHQPRNAGEAGSAPVGVSASPAKLKGLNKARNLRVGVRAITMIRPQCSNREGTGCQDDENCPADWFLTCEHDPYIGKRPVTRQVPIYSEPHEDGSVTLERMEDRLTWETWPHFSEVIQMLVANSGMGVEKARRKGYILPEEVRSPLYPAGIAPMCQFRACRSQEGLVEYKWGTFCREAEARMVGLRSTDAEGNLIYGAAEIHNQGKRQKQIESVAV